MKVSEILKLKGNILYTAPPDMPLLEAINIMSDRDVGSLMDGRLQWPGSAVMLFCWKADYSGQVPGRRYESPHLCSHLPAGRLAFLA